MSSTHVSAGTALLRSHHLFVFCRGVCCVLHGHCSAGPPFVYVWLWFAPDVRSIENKRAWRLATRQTTIHRYIRGHATLQRTQHNWRRGRGDGFRTYLAAAVVVQAAVQHQRDAAASGERLCSALEAEGTRAGGVRCSRHREGSPTATPPSFVWLETGARHTRRPGIWKRIGAPSARRAESVCLVVAVPPSFGRARGAQRPAAGEPTFVSTHGESRAAFGKQPHLMRRYGGWQNHRRFAKDHHMATTLSFALTNLHQTKT
ncbi:hypothetical protein NDU88_001748 [Pleurodeles waltl]|uniref:Transposase DDE domain-containing protein n=1 Tax=Pleurodeles waltl TaxID=8319 RepID=A0AAV7UBA1_PLEWA|nr:hypothetical protein NDU88_001748 [Pleurodeles waltl]